jgi:hypothetical protein
MYDDYTLNQKATWEILFLSYKQHVKLLFKLMGNKGYKVESLEKWVILKKFYKRGLWK